MVSDLFFWVEDSRGIYHVVSEIRTTIVMHHPLPITHSKSMILFYLQIIHHAGPRHDLPSRDHPIRAIGPQHMHAQRDLPDRQKAFLLGQEGVLLVSMDHFIALEQFVMLCWNVGGQREIDQVMVGMNPDMQDRFLLHFVRLGIVGQHVFTHLQLPNRFFPLLGRDSSLRSETARLGTGGRHRGDRWQATLPTAARLWLWPTGSGTPSGPQP